MISKNAFRTTYTFVLSKIILVLKHEMFYNVENFKHFKYAEMLLILTTKSYSSKSARATSVSRKGDFYLFGRLFTDSGKKNLAQNFEKGLKILHFSVKLPWRS